MRWWMVLAVGSLVLPLAGGCASSPEGASTGVVSAPHLVALSSYEASLGTLIEGYGQNFALPREGRTFLVFDGTFTTKEGASHPVDEEFQVRTDSRGTLIWESYGPYRVPFGPGNEAGVFRGTAAAKTVLEDGTTLEDPQPVDISFHVEPSILVQEFQPTSASCGKPIKRALARVPYRLRTRAVGFEPESFTYTLSVPGIDELQGIQLRHVAAGAVDRVGADAEFRFPAVPEDVKYYGAKLGVQARSVDGRTYTNVFAIGVHRPIEVFYNGNVHVAEIYEPKPVTGCIPGGEIGRNADYREMTTETRSRNYELNWNESWKRSHTVEVGSKRTVTVDRRNAVGFGVTEEDLIRWEVGGEAGGTIGKEGVLSLGFKGHMNKATQRSEAVERTRERERGLERSETTTRTESQTESNTEEEGGSIQWEVSSSETVARGFGGYILPHAYGTFYRQTIRLLRRGLLVTYNQCGVPKVVGDVDFTDWTWAPDLAMGRKCPPFPQSNLPAASCEIPPCGSSNEN